MEFVFEASDFRMDYSVRNVRNDTWLYWEILPFFDLCTGPKGIPNQVLNMNEQIQSLVILNMEAEFLYAI